MNIICKPLNMVLFTYKNILNSTYTQVLGMVGRVGGLW